MQTVSNYQYLFSICFTVYVFQIPMNINTNFSILWVFIVHFKINVNSNIMS